MLFGISTFVWASPFTTDQLGLLEKAKTMGYDILEIAIEDASLVDWRRVRAKALALDLKITISGAFGAERDLSSNIPEHRNNAFRYIQDCIKTAAYLESPIFGGPLYSAVGKTRLVSPQQKQQERDWCVQALYQLATFAKQEGVVLGMEPLNRFETDMVNTVDQGLSILDEVAHASLQMVMDTFHANIEEKDIAQAIRKIGKARLCHVQGNESDRGTPGTGHLEWQDIRKALIDIDYQGAVVIETFGQPSKALAKAACIWRPLANSADELATEGIAFYRELFSPITIDSL